MGVYMHMCCIQVEEPECIYTGKKKKRKERKTHLFPVCLFIREHGVSDLSPWASKISGLDFLKRRQKVGNNSTMLPVNIAAKTQRKHNYKHSLLN